MFSSEICLKDIRSSSGTEMVPLSHPLISCGVSETRCVATNFNSPFGEISNYLLPCRGKRPAESETASEFSNLTPVTIEWSHQLLLGHSENKMVVDFESLLLCVMLHKTPLGVMAIPEMAIIFPHEEKVLEISPFIAADLCFEHINRVNRELRTLRSDYITVRHVLCFWQPHMNKMATWL